MIMYSRKLQTAMNVEVLCDDVGHYMDGRPFLLVMREGDESGEQHQMLALPAGIRWYWNPEAKCLTTVGEGAEKVDLVHAYMYEPDGENWDDFEMVLSWKTDADPVQLLPEPRTKK